MLVAVEEGAVELDEPVGRHLAAYAAGPRAAVTPRHLLSHASGLPESGPAGVPALEVELARPPATRRVYSNEGYAVLGELLAAATGIPHPDYVRQAVFEPLGMDAYLGLPEHEDARALRVREPGMWRPGLQLFNSIEWRRRATAAGGAFATVDAYARIVQVLLSRGAPLIAPETAADMARAAVPGHRRRDRVVPDLGRRRLGARLRHPRREGAALALGRLLARPPCRTSAPPAR